MCASLVMATPVYVQDLIVPLKAATTFPALSTVTGESGAIVVRHVGVETTIRLETVSLIRYIVLQPGLGTNLYANVLGWLNRKSSAIFIAALAGVCGRAGQVALKAAPLVNGPTLERAKLMENSAPAELIVATTLVNALGRQRPQRPATPLTVPSGPPGAAGPLVAKLALLVNKLRLEIAKSMPSSVLQTI